MIYLVGLFIFILVIANSSSSKSSKSVSNSNSNLPKSDFQRTLNTSTSRVKPASQNGVDTPSSASISGKEVTGDFVRSTRGFIPSDKCSCGGTWIKHENRKTGGRFFGCSRYPSCKNTRDKQERQSRTQVRKCPNGHVRTIWNTEDNELGKQSCLDCENERELKRLEFLERQEKHSNNGVSKDSREVCRNGHPRTSDNTYFRPDGQRECRICRRNAR